MKTLKQLREEYDSRVLNQVTIAPEELMLEGMTKKSRVVPLPSEMPAMLLFRRMAYKLYPGHQVVALYYSKAINKYLSVPFGPDGNINLSESEIYDTLEELELNEGAKWEAIKGGLKGALHGTIRGGAIGGAIAPGPGTAIGAVVGGVRGAYKGAKRGLEKAKEQNMEEDWQDVNRKDRTDGLSQAAVNAYRRENPGSNLQTAVTEKNPSGKRAARRKSFCARMGGMKKRLTSAKTARDPDSNINKALRRWNCEESFRSKLSDIRDMNEGIMDAVTGAITGGLRGGIGGAIAGGIGGLMSGGSSGDEKEQKQKEPMFQKVQGGHARAIRGPKTRSSWETRQDPKSTLQSRYDAATMRDIEASKHPQKVAVRENKISDLRTMISEGNETMDLSINGRQVTLNNSMAKRILEVYDSVNTKNKRIVESMLNEDLESFKKLLNFSIKA